MTNLYNLKLILKNKSINLCPLIQFTNQENFRQLRLLPSWTEVSCPFRVAIC